MSNMLKTADGRPRLTYYALIEPVFPCNPLPFAAALGDHVREFGTDSIKSDEAKRLLWILMAQAYGQMHTIDLNDEWDRLYRVYLAEEGGSL